MSTSITATNKDLLLRILCENCEPERLVHVNKSELYKLTGIDNSATNAMLAQMVRMGLLEQAIENHSAFDIIVRADAFDFLGRGAFTIQEELLQKNIEKLLKEIDNLEPSRSEQAERIASIASAIMTALGFFIKGR